MDNRQAIFLKQDEGMLSAIFIDHGHMFGGPKGDEIPPIAASRYLDHRIYDKSFASLTCFERILAKRLNADRLWSLALALPAEWRSESALTAFANYLNRLSSSQFVQDISNSIIASFGYPSDSALSYKEYGTGTGTILHSRVLSAKVQGRIVA